MLETDHATAQTTTYTYRYTLDGQRYWSAGGTQASEYYLRDGAVTLGVFTSTGTRVYWNLLGPSGEVFGRQGSSGTNDTRFHLKDNLGSVRVSTNISGSSVVGTSDYYPFGLQMPGRLYRYNANTREDYTGHELDGETGYLYAGARYYNPAIGRWNAVDPLADSYAGWSPYNYSFNNPVSFTDPDGMAPQDWVGRMNSGGQAELSPHS